MANWTALHSGYCKKLQPEWKEAAKRLKGA